MEVSGVRVRAGEGRTGQRGAGEVKDGSREKLRHRGENYMSDTGQIPQMLRYLRVSEGPRVGSIALR